MAVSKKKDSPYYYTRFAIGGVRVQESTRTTTKREAEEYEEKRKREIRQYVFLGKKLSRPWPEAVMRWCEEMKYKKSLDTDVYIFGWLANYLDSYTLDQINKDVIESVIRAKEEQGASDARINRILALIRALLNRAYKKWEWIDKTPHIPMRKLNNKIIRWLTKDEAHRLLKELEKTLPHLYPMAKFSLATGLRKANVYNLKWQDVDMANQHVTIYPEQSKSGKGIAVPLNIDAISVLREQIGKHDSYVFTYKGKPITEVGKLSWRKALKRAGIENFRWHDFRHTWASWHVQSGTSLHELQQLGGWASYDMVLRYAHLSSGHLKQAADRISSKPSKPILKLVGEQ